MARRSKGIQWTENQRKQLKEAVNRFNKELREAKKIGIPSEILPQKATVKDMKRRIKSRVDLNRYIAATKRATQKTLRPIRIESGLVISKWELQEAERAVKLINKQREKEYSRLKALEKSSERVMGSEIVDSYRPKKMPSQVSPTNWGKYIKSFEQASTLYQAKKESEYVRRYKKALRNIFGDKASKINKLLNNLPDSYIYEMAFYNSDTEISFVYDEDMDSGSLYDTILSAWEWASMSYNE